MTGVRSLDLWELVCWTYRDQKAHQYLAEVSDWFDWAIDQTTSGEIDVNVPVHHDAAQVHAAVLALGFTDRMQIIQSAEIGERPDFSTARPRPLPMRPDEGRLQACDRPSWSATRTGRISYVIRTIEKTRVVETVERRAGRKRAKVMLDERSVPFDVEWCPLEWYPSPEYVAMVNAIYVGWVEAMLRLELALSAVKLRRHVLTGFAFDAAPDVEPVLEYGQAREAVSAAMVRDETVQERLELDGDEPVVRRLIRRVRVMLHRPESEPHVVA